MGFICPDCGKDFGRNKEAFETHRLQAHSRARIYMTAHGLSWEHAQPQKPKRKTSPNLSALIDAVQDGRVQVRVGFDGDIVFRITKTQKEYTIPAEYVTGNYEGFDEE